MSVSERKKREKELRRESIVDAAEKMIKVKGFDGMTMDDVAVIAELGKGTIDLYFKNKIDLYHAVVCRGLKLLKGNFERVVKKKARAVDNLLAIGHAYYRFCVDHPLYFNAMMHQEVMEVGGDDPSECEGMQCCQEVGNQIFAILGELIQAGIRDGSIRTDLEPTKLSMLLWAQVTGVLKMTMTKGEVFEKFWGVTAAELLDYQFALIRQAITPQAKQGAKR
jgi:AcrR family transcriptional regulator